MLADKARRAERGLQQQQRLQQDGSEGEGEGQAGQAGEAPEALARRLEVHQQVQEACARVVAACGEGLQEWSGREAVRRREQDAAPVDAVGRVGVLVMAVGYATYAWHIEEVSGGISAADHRSCAAGCCCPMLPARRCCPHAPHWLLDG